MQTEFEKFQLQTRQKENLRYHGQNSFSQIRSFIDGKSVPPSQVLDNFAWLIGGGYKRIRISGEVPETLVNRLERPICSLEKFFSEYLQYFFREDFDRARVEDLYLKFTNQMTAEDVKIVYAATSGQIEIDPDLLESYAGDRRFANGAYIFRRPFYDEIKAQEAEERKIREESVVRPDPNFPEKVSNDPLEQISLDLDDDPTLDPMASPLSNGQPPSPASPKKKVEKTETKREPRKTRVPKAKN